MSTSHSHMTKHFFASIETAEGDPEIAAQMVKLSVQPPFPIVASGMAAMTHVIRKPG